MKLPLLLLSIAFMFLLFCGVGYADNCVNTLNVTPCYVSFSNGNYVNFTFTGTANYTNTSTTMQLFPNILGNYSALNLSSGQGWFNNNKTQAPWIVKDNITIGISSASGGCDYPNENYLANAATNYTFCSGTYMGLLDADGNGVIQVSNQAKVICQGTIIQGNDVANSQGFNFDTTGGSVQGCNIQNESDAFYSWDGTSINIFNNTINNSNDRGILLRITSKTNITYNSIYNTAYGGIRLYVTANKNNISNNIVSNRTISTSNYGIHLTGNGTNNTISYNNISGVYDGINLIGDAFRFTNTNVNHNYISNLNVAGGGTGIFLSFNTSSSVIDNNTVINSSWNGIATHGYNINITNNYVLNPVHHCYDFNGLDAVPMIQSYNINIWNNTGIGCVNGIYTSNLTNSSIMNNILIGVTDTAVKLDSLSTNNLVQGNLLSAVTCVNVGVNSVSYALGSNIYYNTFNCTGYVLSTDSRYMTFLNNNYVGSSNKFYIHTGTGSFTNTLVQENTTNYLFINYSGDTDTLKGKVNISYSSYKNFSLTSTGSTYQINFLQTSDLINKSIVNQSNGNVGVINNVPSYNLTVGSNEQYTATKSYASGGCDNIVGNNLTTNYTNTLCLNNYKYVNLTINSPTNMYFVMGNNNFTFKLFGLSSGNANGYPYYDIYLSNASYSQGSETTSGNTWNGTLSPGMLAFIFNYLTSTEPRYYAVPGTITSLSVINYSSGSSASLSCVGTGNLIVTNLLSLAGTDGYYRIYHNGVKVGYANSPSYTIDSCSDWLFTKFDSVPITGQTGFIVTSAIMLLICALAIVLIKRFIDEGQWEIGALIALVVAIIILTIVLSFLSNIT